MRLVLGYFAYWIIHESHGIPVSMAPTSSPTITPTASPTTSPTQALTVSNICPSQTGPIARGEFGVLVTSTTYDPANSLSTGTFPDLGKHFYPIGSGSNMYTVMTEFNSTLDSSAYSIQIQTATVYGNNLNVTSIGSSSAAPNITLINRVGVVSSTFSPTPSYMIANGALYAPNQIIVTSLGGAYNTELFATAVKNGVAGKPIDTTIGTVNYQTAGSLAAYKGDCAQQLKIFNGITIVCQSSSITCPAPSPSCPSTYTVLTAARSEANEIGGVVTTVYYQVPIDSSVVNTPLTSKMNANIDRNGLIVIVGQVGTGTSSSAADSVNGIGVYTLQTYGDATQKITYLTTLNTLNTGTSSNVFVASNQANSFLVVYVDSSALHYYAYYTFDAFVTVQSAPELVGSRVCGSGPCMGSNGYITYNLALTSDARVNFFEMSSPNIYAFQFRWHYGALGTFNANTTKVNATYGYWTGPVTMFTAAHNFTGIRYSGISSFGYQFVFNQNDDPNRNDANQAYVLNYYACLPVTLPKPVSWAIPPPSLGMALTILVITAMILL